MDPRISYRCSYGIRPDKGAFEVENSAHSAAHQPIGISRGPKDPEECLAPRDLACRYTDENRYSISESSVYRILKAADPISRRPSRSVTAFAVHSEPLSERIQVGVPAQGRGHHAPDAGPPPRSPGPDARGDCCRSRRPVAEIASPRPCHLATPGGHPPSAHLGSQSAVQVPNERNPHLVLRSAGILRDHPRPVPDGDPAVRGGRSEAGLDSLLRPHPPRPRGGPHADRSGRALYGALYERLHGVPIQRAGRDAPRPTAYACEPTLRGLVARRGRDPIGVLQYADDSSRAASSRAGAPRRIRSASVSPTCLSWKGHSRSSP